MNTLFYRLRLLCSVIVALSVAVPSAKADSACAVGNLSTLMGTTCNIGSLQFTFTGLSSDNFSNNGDAPGSTTFYDDPLNPNDFTFTPVSNGFAITITAGPQTITSSTGYPGGGTAETVETADLTFDVTDLDGNITGMSAAGVLGTSGPYTMSEIRGTVGSGGNLFGESVAASGGGSETDNLIDIGSPFANGSGGAGIINMYGQDGDSAYWGGVSAFTFATAPAPSPTPEPGSLALLASGLTLSAAVIRRRYKPN